MVTGGKADGRRLALPILRRHLDQVSIKHLYIIAYGYTTSAPQKKERKALHPEAGFPRLHLRCQKRTPASGVDRNQGAQKKMRKGVLTSQRGSGRLIVALETESNVL